MTVRSMQEAKTISHGQVSRKVITSHINERRHAMAEEKGSLQSQLHDKQVAKKNKETIVKFRTNPNKIFLKLMTRSKLTIRRIK